MKTILVLCLAVISASAETYDTKYDDTDTKPILSNCRMLVPHMKCVLDTGKCTPAAQTMKDKINDALDTKCSKCSEKQKEKIKEVMCNLSKCQPTFMKLAMDKYDKDGSRRKQNQSKFNELTTCEEDCTEYKECDINTGRPVGE